MLIFANPWMALLLPLPIIFWFLLKSSKTQVDDKSPEILFPYVNRLYSAFTLSTKAAKPKSKFWFITILSALWIFLVISVMRPELIEITTHVNKKGYDIMMAVDISPSMSATDFSTNEKKVTRLDVVKEVVGNFVKARNGDRLGLILFGEHAYLQVPMTFDNFAMSQMLKNAVSGMAGAATAIGDAIGIAVLELRNRPSNSRILVLLTDGTDNSSNVPPLEAAQIAGKYNIRIYTIGIGSDTPVSYYDNFGNVVGVDAGINEVLLEKIAEITGGKYFRAKDDYSLEKIYSKINELEKVDLSIVEHRSESLHRYPLFVACLLFLILCIMPLRIKRI